MEVFVQGSRSFPSGFGRKSLILVPDSWNDYHYTTAYDLWIRDGNSSISQLGLVKIGRVGLGTGERPLTPDYRYSNGLPDDVFSLGQGQEYYSAIRSLGDSTREEILHSLRDIAFDDEIFLLAAKSDVTSTSLMRSFETGSITNQFRRIAMGGISLTAYSFKYTYPANGELESPAELTFDVTPGSNPPSNVHVIIGRNGSGKTSLLKRLTNCLTGEGNYFDGELVDLNKNNNETFVSLVSVAFSAFDPFDPDSVEEEKAYDGRVPYHYVGLRGARGGPNSLKDDRALTREFVDSLAEVVAASSQDRWLKAIEMLRNDQNFDEYDIGSVLVAPDNREQANKLALNRDAATKRFSSMSSGHKIVLLTVTKLVQLVAEQSLVLLDEPESHLHPPLLAAFVRALSELLNERNGVAIVATHSPVLLQEVPSSCVWILRRSGEEIQAERPEIETFGEGIGVLTHEVFDLEVSGSGFHREIARAVEENATYDAVIKSFKGQIGGEGRALARSMISSKNRQHG